MSAVKVRLVLLCSVLLLQHRNAGYRPALKWLDKITAAVEVSGMGEIWWNEQNTARQPFYALLCASVGLHWKYASLHFYGKNMTGSRYDVFRFKSMDNEFLQRGKPYDRYNATALKGTITPDSLCLSCKLGTFPIAYRGAIQK